MEERKIIAREGMWLTDGTIFAKVVFLGLYDKLENWHEISDEEYAAMQEEEAHD